MNRKEKDRIKGRKGGGEGRPIYLEKGKLSKRENVEKLISLLGAFGENEPCQA